MFLIKSHIFAAKQVITFTQKLEEINAKEKDTMATFECETNEPFVKVKWLKNNMEIFSGDKYRMHSDRKVHFLSVLMLEVKDNAEYSCVVIDDESVRTSANLNVEGGKKRELYQCCLIIELIFSCKLVMKAAVSELLSASRCEQEPLWRW